MVNVMGLRVGLDFDNTIVDYRPLFAAALARLGIASLDANAPEKTGVRDRLRALPDGEARWQQLQAELYGTAIAGAPAYPGLTQFLARARERGDRLVIVSHKSRFAAAAPHGPDLQEAARAWLVAAGIAGDAIAHDDIYFAATRAEKIERIRALELTHFVDDLADVLDDPAFPPQTRAILFRESWDEVTRAVYG
jgi:hypothetical protein